MSKEESNATVTAEVPELLTPMVISLDNYAVLIGALNPKVYKKLIHIDQNNEYKVHISKITEKDMQ